MPAPLIYLATRLKRGPWGGGNQFLRSLADALASSGQLASSPADSDAILYNSYQDIPRALWLRLWHRRQVFVHRLGPVLSLHRPCKWKNMDKLVLHVANAVADAVIFQSEWSREQAVAMGFAPQGKDTVVYNTVDSAVFYPRQKKLGEKIKLIAVSWSDNPKKGGEIYTYLDNHLDFSRYEMTFVGHAKEIFKNIRVLGVRTREEVASLLREHDIFVSASADDACSNAILEALASGLPVVALNSGANAELVAGGGVLFRGTADVVQAVAKATEQYEVLSSSVRVTSMNDVVNAYLRAAGATRRSVSVWTLLYLFVQYLFIYSRCRFL